jgi:hypothetical protein
MITILLWKKSCIDLFIERLDIVLSDFSPDICPWADIAVALPVFTYGQNYKYVINKYKFDLSVNAISAHGQISGEKSDSTISSLSINRSMHDFFHSRTVIIPQLISITLIHISLVSLWEINFVDFQSAPIVFRIEIIYQNAPLFVA